MPQINKLPNYYAGKLYRRWDSVKSMFGEGGILASRTDKDGRYIQLLITDNGKKREILYPDEKIMDTLDINGLKRTYTYKKEGANTVKGQMITENTTSHDTPLIVAAKWIAENCMPKRLVLKLNPEHRNAEAFIPAEHLSENATADIFGIGKKIKVSEILVKDFENEYNPMPKTVIFKTPKGTTEAITTQTGEENSQIIKQFGIDSDVLGRKLRTMV